MESLSSTHSQQGNRSIAYEINTEGSENNEKELTMTFVRDVIVEKKRSETQYRFRMVMENKSS